MAKRADNSSAEPVLRGRVWVDLGGGAVLTEAAADLLEQIEATGSLSEAARRLRFSYRRAWVLLDTANRRWPWAVVSTAIATRTHVAGTAAAAPTGGTGGVRRYRPRLVAAHTIPAATRSGVN